MYFLLFLCFLSTLTLAVHCKGLLLLYRPRDISNECAYSHRLRYDISFGMGMSDTITLVFRTLADVDYECSVEIVSESPLVHIVVVIKYPTSIEVNCGANPDAFIVMKKNKCLRLCDVVGERNVHLPYFVAAVKGRMRFKFLSNSSINADMNANLYQVTATSARRKPNKGCNKRNETICDVNDEYYCFTSGVVCDGVNNCGVSDWFDERKSDCGLPVERLGYAPVIAVVAAMLCAVLAAGHILLRCLPPLADSFFIFNANEDNRLCIDPVFKPPGVGSHNIEKIKNTSLIPISSSSSSNAEERGDTQPIEHQPPNTREETTKTSEALSAVVREFNIEETRTVPKRKARIKSMSEKINKRFRTNREAKTKVDEV